MTAGIQGETSTLADMNIVISTVNRLTRNTPIYFQAFLAWLQVKSEVGQTIKLDSHGIDIALRLCFHRRQKIKSPSAPVRAIEKPEFDLV